MKIATIFIFLICILLFGCTIPCNVFFRNLSNETVPLKGKLVDRWYFDKLPNKVDFYYTVQKGKQIYGKWKYQKLITWTDFTTFYIDIPQYSIIDEGKRFGRTNYWSKVARCTPCSFFKYKNEYTNPGDYASLAAKFQVKRTFFSNPVYYYDIKQ